MFKTPCIFRTSRNGIAPGLTIESHSQYPVTKIDIRHRNRLIKNADFKNFFSE